MDRKFELPFSDSWENTLQTKETPNKVRRILNIFSEMTEL